MLLKSTQSLHALQRPPAFHTHTHTHPAKERHSFLSAESHQTFVGGRKAVGKSPGESQLPPPALPTRGVPATNPGVRGSEQVLLPVLLPVLLSVLIGSVGLRAIVYNRLSLALSLSQFRE